MTDASMPRATPSTTSRHRPARSGRARGPALALVAALALAACDSPEERAENHFQEALAFIEAGDTTRAELELRNVFDLNGLHRDARATYAALRREAGDVRESYSQYLRLVEQYPDDLEGLRELALMATARRDWDQVRRYGTAGIEIAPEDPGLRAAMASLAYRDALEAEDMAAADAAAEEARVILGEAPELSAARILVADQLLRDGSDDLALEVVEAGVEIEPENRDLRQLRLGLLARSGDSAALRSEIEESLALFPDDENLSATYLRLLVSEGDLDAAEAYLRGRIDPEDPAFEDRATLLDFQRRLRGPDAMRAELDALIADPEVADRALLRAMRAGLDFEEGRREEGVQAMAALMSEIEEGGGGLAPEQLARLHVSLARMREATGDRVGARASVESALEVEPGQPDALKLRAAWQIESDETVAAISSLRAALAGAPRDAQIMTLLAQAHRRDGDIALAGDMLARAVEVSGNAPAESLRYATFLSGQGRAASADAVISDALRLAPEDVELLAALGRLRAAGGEWDRVGDIIDRLRQIGDEAAALQADNLEATLLAGQERTEDLETFLGEIAEGDGAGALGAKTALIRTAIAEGDIEGALTRAGALVEADPEDAQLRLLRGAVRIAAGRGAEGVEDIREATRLDPESERARLALVRAVRQVEGAEAGAQETAAAAEAFPDSVAIQWLRASDLERDGDSEAAIAIYEDLYARDDSMLVVANNLASLLSLTSDDPAELERAERMARRLRQSTQPAFRDTYGWILHRLGRSQDALEHLAFAAQGAPGVPLIRLHHGIALAAAGEPEAARGELDAVVALTEGEAAAAGDPDGTLRARAIAALSDLGGAAPAPESEPESEPGSEPAPAASE